MSRKPSKKSAIPTAAAERKKNGQPRTGAGPRPDAERIATVERMLLQQFSPAEIVRQLVKEPVLDPETGERVGGGYGVSDRTIRDDLRRVYANLAEDREEERQAARNAALGTARSMFRKAVVEGDLKIADKFFDKICRILGAYAPDALKVATVDLEALAGLSDDALNAEIRREVEKLLAALPEKERASVVAALGKGS